MLVSDRSKGPARSYAMPSAWVGTWGKLGGLGSGVLGREDAYFKFGGVALTAHVVTARFISLRNFEKKKSCIVTCLCWQDPRLSMQNTELYTWVMGAPVRPKFPAPSHQEYQGPREKVSFEEARVSDA